VAQVVEHLPSKFKALSSNALTVKKKSLLNVHDSIIHNSHKLNLKAHQMMTKHTFIKHPYSRALVAHAYNSSYSGGLRFKASPDCKIL
jgi:hypothetical protein